MIGSLWRHKRYSESVAEGSPVTLDIVSLSMLWQAAVAGYDEHLLASRDFSQDFAHFGSGKGSKRLRGDILA